MTFPTRHAAPVEKVMEVNLVFDSSIIIGAELDHCLLTNMDENDIITRILLEKNTSTKQNKNIWIKSNSYVMKKILQLGT